MKTNSENFLRDLDKAYARGEQDGVEDYCLECSVPGSSSRPFRRYDCWVSTAEFHPTNKISELLKKHGLDLKEFLTAWVRVTGLMISGDGDDPMVYWQRGHMPCGCPSRSTVIKVLELL